MKRISLFLALFLAGAITANAQDAATEEKLNRLNGLVQDLLEDKANQKKQIAELSKEVQSLREQLNRPSANYASAEDLRRLADTVKEIDRKRADDNERVVRQIEKLGNVVTSSAAKAKPAPAITEKPSVSTSAPIPDKGYEYVVEPGDTLSVIAAAYSKQGIKVTTDQILKANPGLKPTSLKIGQKIFIPAQ